MKPVIIKYNGDPNAPLEISHCANFENCTMILEKEFEVFSYNSALEVFNFMAECTDIITEFKHIAWAFEKYPRIKNMMNFIDLTASKATRNIIRTQAKKEHYKSIDKWKVETIDL